MPNYFAISPCIASPCPSSSGGSPVFVIVDHDVPNEICCPAHGNGSPEGVVTKPEGVAYVDDLNQEIYDKVIGEDAFGWVLRVNGGGGGSGNFFAVATIAQARALPSLVGNKILEINGSMTGGDGETHLRYTWENGRTDPNNNGDVLASTDGLAGRWLQQL